MPALLARIPPRQVEGDAKAMRNEPLGDDVLGPLDLRSRVRIDADAAAALPMNSDLGRQTIAELRDQAPRLDVPPGEHERQSPLLVLG